MDIRVLMALQEAVNKPKLEQMTKAYATNFNVKADTNKIESKVLGTGRWVKDTIPGRRSVSGDFELQPSISQIELVLQGAGFKKSTNTFKASPFEKFLTLINDFPSDGLHIQYQDCLVNTLGISVSQEEYVNVKVGIIGMKDTLEERKIEDSKITKSSETEKQLIFYGAILKDTNNDISATVESVEININNSLEGRGGLNSQHFTKILQSGRGSIDVSIRFNSFEKDNYKKALEMLKSNGSVKLELTLAEEYGENLTEAVKKGKQLKITLPNVKMNSVDLEDLEGAGGITKNMSALPDKNGDPITFEIIEKETNSLGR